MGQKQYQRLQASGLSTCLSLQPSNLYIWSSIQDGEERLTGLLQDGQGPFYRVGNALIARLAALHGDSWVRDRLGEPAVLLQAYLATGEWPQAGDLPGLLEQHQAQCPLWFPKGR